MDEPVLAGFKQLIEAIINTSPVAMVAATFDSEQSALGKQFAITLIIPLFTAMITAGVTAWATQAVMTEQIKEIKEQVQYNRDTTLRVSEKLDGAIVRNNERVMRIETWQEFNSRRFAK